MPLCRSRLIRLTECGSRIYVVRDRNDPKRFGTVGNYCHDRFCLPCSNARSSKIARTLATHLEGKELRFITLTIKTDGQPLAACLNKVYESFAKLKRSGLWKRCVTGGVAFLENKYSEKKSRWHPHFHLLVEGTFFPRELLSKEWLKCTGDSFIVDVRRVDSATNAWRYVTKYACKSLHSSYVHDSSLITEAIHAMTGRRLVITFGSWRGRPTSTEPSKPDWELIDRFECVLRAAVNGNEEARFIMEQLGVRRPDCERPPKPPPPDRESAATGWTIEADGLSVARN